MASLFIDSTYDITIGILDDTYSWLRFEKFHGQKSSSILQTEVHRFLNETGIRAHQLENIVTIAGPGFYTGLRLSEGVADVFQFVGKNILSFYSYDIPAYLGKNSGSWMTKAYRGEYFFHHWDERVNENILIPDKNIKNFLENLDPASLYIHSDSALDDVCRSVIHSSNSTHEMLRTDSKKIFSKVFGSGLKVESFYFRAPEDEFRVSK